MSDNPYESSEVPQKSDLGSADKSDLGSLSQSARSKNLNTARGILLFVGILSVGYHAFVFVTIESQVDAAIENEISKTRRPGMTVNFPEVERVKKRAVKIGRLLSGAFLAVGVVFIILGLVVKKYPVPATLIGLVLYIGSIAVVGVIHPPSVLQGIVVKVFIIIGLISSLNAAFAYQREQKNIEAQQFGLSGTGPV